MIKANMKPYITHSALISLVITSHFFEIKELENVASTVLIIASIFIIIGYIADKNLYKSEKPTAKHIEWFVLGLFLAVFAVGWFFTGILMLIALIVYVASVKQKPGGQEKEQA